MTRSRDAGVILVNVLVALALGAALVTLMLTSQDGAIDRARRASSAAQAEALALGAELSVLVALRRDMSEAPEVDHLGEPWAQAAQVEVALETGRFAVAIRDAQAGLDLNGLASGGVAQLEVLTRLVAELDLPPETAEHILTGLRYQAPLRHLDQIEGLDAASLARLEPYVALLPTPAPVNLNTAEPLLMGVLLRNRVAARRLADLRERNGEITARDLGDLGLVPSGATGFGSDVWDVSILAEVDDVVVTLSSRLVRRQAAGVAEVLVTERRFGVAASEILPLPTMD